MMKALVIHVIFLLITGLVFPDNKVLAQEGPGIVIAQPGQDIELFCTVTVTSDSQETAWLVNRVGPFTLSRIINESILPGHTAMLGSKNLIVENIMMNDGRNDSMYKCVIVPSEKASSYFTDTIKESDLTILYVADVPTVISEINNISNIIRDNVTLALSWEEPFNNLDPIVSYTVSCSGDDTCPPNFTTTDNTTRSYTITNLTPMTNYTFSVVATNSIGSGEAGVVNITTPQVEIIITSRVDLTSSLSVFPTPQFSFLLSLPPTITSRMDITTLTSIKSSVVMTTSIITSSIDIIDLTTVKVIAASDSSVDDHNEFSIGAAVAISITITFIITLIISVMSSIIFTSIYYKHKELVFNQEGALDPQALSENIKMHNSIYNSTRADITKDADLAYTLTS